jgi:hypothetical protein
MQNNEGEFFCRTRKRRSSKVVNPAFSHFSTNRDPVKGKSSEWLLNNHKTMKRQGLRRPVSGLRKAKEAAAAGHAWQTEAFSASQERRINREFSFP